jgi:diguanylate cyclase (GGDEF)-like protein
VQKFVAAERSRPIAIIFGLVVPVLYVSLILIADYVEGPRIAFAGAAIAAPFMASIFAGPFSTSITGAVLLGGIYILGLSSDEAGRLSQLIRLGMLAIGCILAVFYSWYRRRRDLVLLQLLRERTELEMTSALGLNDELTGLMNRRGLMSALESEDRWPRTVAVFDLDGLKEVNDRFGHNHGDDYIAAIASRLRGGLAASDIVCRWGGDEFLVIVPLPIAEAEPVFTRVIVAIIDQPIVASSHRIRPHLSAGAAPWKPSESLESAALEADALMYQAKLAGGNRILVAKE